MLLETTKSYVCNVLPIPILIILLSAKKVKYKTVKHNFRDLQVICRDWNTVLIDDFLEIIFKYQRDCINIIQQVKEIREETQQGMCL